MLICLCLLIFYLCFLQKGLLILRECFKRHVGSIVLNFWCLIFVENSRKKKKMISEILMCCCYKEKFKAEGHTYREKLIHFQWNAKRNICITFCFVNIILSVLIMVAQPEMKESKMVFLAKSVVFVSPWDIF